MNKYVNKAIFGEILFPSSSKVNDYVAENWIITYKYAWDHLRCALMGEESLVSVSLNILPRDVINVLYYEQWTDKQK